MSHGLSLQGRLNGLDLILINLKEVYEGYVEMVNTFLGSVTISDQQRNDLTERLSVCGKNVDRLEKALEEVRAIDEEKLTEEEARRIIDPVLNDIAETNLKFDKYLSEFDLTTIEIKEPT